MINTFIHSRSSLENHIRFQTKMGKVYTRFQTKTAQKPYPPDGAANTDTAYLWEYPRVIFTSLVKFFCQLLILLKIDRNIFI